MGSACELVRDTDQPGLAKGTEHTAERVGCPSTSSIPASVQAFLCLDLPRSPLHPHFLLLLQLCGYQDGCLTGATSAAGGLGCNP